ncbi:C5a anaphylatoxin chemotactic receptor 1 [Osmerus mordax]|uniref:C5a anaphylatoxin chemotactic receptor 1 n=1 Tax=Osmerus mordax TaxID=8014 RepID=UPI00350FC864
MSADQEYYFGDIDFDTFFTDEERRNFNFSGKIPVPEISNSVLDVRHVALLVFFGLVCLVGVPGNALVVWVTGFKMPRTVTSIWFLNLALADLLCCLSLPLLMVPIALDQNWPYGAAACTLLKSFIYLVLYCSVLLLVLISVDRWLMVSRPVWCQNWRRPRQAIWVCGAVWLLALLATTPQLVYVKLREISQSKAMCLEVYGLISGWVVMSFRFLTSFLLPFLVIVGCHWVVYSRVHSGSSKATSERSRRTLKVIAAVVLSFFLCWLPLHLMDFVMLATPQTSPHSANVHVLHSVALCLAYLNSCLNPLLYVCLGRGFKQSMNRSLRGLFQVIGEESTVTRTDTSRYTSRSNTLLSQAVVRV